MKKLINILFAIISIAAWGQTDIFWNSLLPNGMELSMPTADSLYRIVHNSALENLSGIVATAYQGDTLFATDGQTLYVIYNNSLLGQYHLNQHTAGQSQAYIVTLFVNQHRQTKIITSVDDTLKVFTWPDIAHPQIFATGIEPVIDVGARLHYNRWDDSVYNEMDIAYLKGQQLYVYYRDFYGHDTTYKFMGISYTSPVRLLRYLNRSVAIVYGDSINLYIFNDQASIYDQGSYKWNVSDVVIDNQSFIVSADTNIYFTDNGCSVENWIKLPSSFQVKQLIPTPYGQLLIMPEQPGQIYALYNMLSVYNPELVVIDTLNQIYSYPINSVTGYNTFFYYELPQSIVSCMRSTLDLKMNTDYEPLLKSDTIDLPRANVMVKVQDTIGLYQAYGRDIKKRLQDTMPVITTYISASDAHIDFLRVDDTTYQLRAEGQGNDISGPVQWYYNDSLVSTDIVITVNQEGTYTLRISDSKCTKDTSVDIFFKHRADLFWNSYLPNQMELSAPTADSIYRLLPNSALDALSGIVATAYKGDTLFATDGQTLYVIYNNSLISEYRLNQHPAGREQAYILTMFYKEQEQTKIITDIDDTLKIFTWPDISHPHILATGIESVMDVGSQVHSDADELGSFMYNDMNVAYLKDGNFYLYSQPDLIEGCTTQVHNNLAYDSSVQIIKYRNYQLAIKDDTSVRLIRFQGDLQTIEYEQSNDWPATDIAIAKNLFIISTDTSIITTNIRYKRFIDLPSSYKVKQLLFTDYGQLIAYPQSSGDLYALFNSNLYYMDYAYLRKIGSVSEVYEPYINQVNYQLFYIKPENDRVSACQRANIVVQLNPYTTIKTFNYDFPEADSVVKVQATIGFNDVNSVRVVDHIQDAMGIVSTYLWGEKPYIKSWREDYDIYSLEAWLNGDSYYGNLEWVYNDSVIGQSNDIMVSQEGTYTLRVQDSKCTFDTSTYILFGYKADLFWNSFLPNGMELAVPSSQSLYKQVDNATLDALSGIVATAYKGDTLFATDGQTLYVIYNNSLIGQYYLNQHTAGFEQAYIVTLFYKAQKQTKIITDIDDSLKIFTWPDIAHPQLVATGIEPVVDVSSHLTSGTGDMGDFLYNNMIITYLKNNNAYVYRIEDLLSCDSVVVYNGLNYVSPVSLIRYNDNKLALTDKVNTKFFDYFENYGENHFSISLEPSDIYVNHNYFVLNTDSTIIFMNQDSNGYTIDLPPSYKVKQFIVTPYGQLLLYPQEGKDIYAVYNINEEQPTYFTIQRAGNISQVYDYPINIVQGYNPFIELTNEDRPMVGCFRTTIYTKMLPLNNEISWKNVDMPEPGVEQQIIDTISLMKFSSIRVNSHLQDTSAIISTYYKGAKAYISIDGMYLQAKADAMLLQDSVKWFFDGQPDILSTQPSIIPKQGGLYKLQVEDSKCTYLTQINFTFHHQADLFWNSFLPNGMELAASTSDSLYRTVHNQALESLNGIVATSYRGDTLFATDGQTLYVIYNNSLVGQYHLNQHKAGQEQAYIMTIFYKEQEQTKIITSVDDTLKVFTWPDITHPKIVDTGIEPVIDVISRLSSGYDQIGDFLYNDMRIGYLKNHKFYLYQKVDLDSSATIRSYDIVNYSSPVKLLKLLNWSVAYLGYGDIQIAILDQKSLKVCYPGMPDDAVNLSVSPTDVEFIKDHLFVSTLSNVYDYYIWDYNNVDTLQVADVKQIISAPYGQILFYPEHSGQMYYINYPADSIIHQAGYIQQPYAYPMNMLNGYFPVLLPSISTLTGCQDATCRLNFRSANGDIPISLRRIELPEPGTQITIQDTINLNFLRGANQDSLSGIVLVNHTQFDKAILFSSFITTPPTDLQIEQTDSTSWNLELYPSEHIEWYRGNQLLDTTSSIQVDQKGFYTLRVKNNLCTYDTIFVVYAQLKDIYELTNINNYNYKLNDKVQLEEDHIYENQGLVADTLIAKFYLDSTTDYYHDLSSKINYTLLYDYKQKSDSSEFITPVGNSGKHLMGFWIMPKQSQSNYPMFYSQYPVEIFSLKLKPIMQERNYVVGDTARFYIAQDTENADLYIDKHYSNNNFVKFHRTNDSTWLADIAIDQSTSRDIIHPDQLRLALMIATNHADKLKLALVSPDGKEEQVFSGFANPDNNQYIIGNPFCLKYNPDISAETTDEYNRVPEYLGMYPLLFSENGQKLDKTRFPTRSYSDCAMEPEDLNVFDYKSNTIMADFSSFYGSPVAGSWILKVSFPNGPGYYLNIRPFLILSKQDMPHDIFQDTVISQYFNGWGNFYKINDTAIVLTDVGKDTIYFMFDLGYRFQSMESSQTDSAFFVLNVLKGRILYDDQTHTFSPNGDGINDSLNIFTKIVDKFPSLKDINPIDVKIYILNNKGVIIKTLDGATSLSWDGTDRHGKQVASGVYWYIAVIRDQKYYGTIFLLR